MPVGLTQHQQSPSNNPGRVFPRNPFRLVLRHIADSSVLLIGKSIDTPSIALQWYRYVGRATLRFRNLFSASPLRCDDFTRTVP